MVKKTVPICFCACSHPNAGARKATYSHNSLFWDIDLTRDSHPFESVHLLPFNLLFSLAFNPLRSTFVTQWLIPVWYCPITFCYPICVVREERTKCPSQIDLYHCSTNSRRFKSICYFAPWTTHTKHCCKKPAQSDRHPKWIVNLASFSTLYHRANISSRLRQSTTIAPRTDVIPIYIQPWTVHHEEIKSNKIKNWHIIRST